jgi:hypothetical protein
LSTPEGTNDSKKESFDIQSLMRERLPDYIVKCFLAAGFDVPEVISTMDISDNPGNSITCIGIISQRDFLVILNMAAAQPLLDQTCLLISHLDTEYGYVILFLK